jgi:hypothetical protein
MFTLAERDSLAAEGLYRFDEEVRLDQAGRVEHYPQPYVDQTISRWSDRSGAAGRREWCTCTGATITWSP